MIQNILKLGTLHNQGLLNGYNDLMNANLEEISNSAVVLTRAQFTAGLSGLPVSLAYDINVVTFSGNYKYVSLPAVTDDDFGKTVIVQTTNVSAGNNILVGGATVSVNICYSDTNSLGSPYSIAQNGSCKFIYVGGDKWLAEDIQGEKTSINSFKPANNYNDFTLHTTNNTGIALSASALNTAYPNTGCPIGFTVFCPTITLAYIKTGALTWISVATTAVV